MADQVPFWVMLSAQRQLYAESERRTKSQKNEHALRQLTGQTHMSQKVSKSLDNEDDDMQDEDEKAQETLGQMRGSGISEADRYRIAVELRQNIFNWLDEEKDPIGQVGGSKVVLIGAHGRLSNIDDQGYFIEDEFFVYQGKEIHRKAQTC